MARTASCLVVSLISGYDGHFFRRNACLEAGTDLGESVTNASSRRRRIV